MRCSIFLCSLLFLTSDQLTLFTNAVPQCPTSNGNQFWWDGNKCVKCSSCPPGQGVKNTCRAYQDTVCYDCISGHNYSDKDSATDACTLCFEDDPDTLCGYANVHYVQECTPTTKPICDGCKAGYYFYKAAVTCVECSPPCSSWQREIQSCSHNRNRICQDYHSKSAPDTTPSSFTTTQHVPLVTSPHHTKTGSDTLESSTGQVTATRTEGSFLTLLPSPWNWILLCIGVLAVLVIISVILWKCYKHQQRKKNRENFIAEEGIPLQAITPAEVTAHDPRPAPASSVSYDPCVCLDSPFLHLPLAWRQDIAIKLVSGDKLGYDPWKLVAEELGVEKSHIHYWDCRSPNPAEELFRHYEKMDGSTIRRFIGILKKQQGGSLLANEMEEGISRGLASPSELYAGLASPPEPNGDIKDKTSHAPSEVQETEV